MAAAETDRDAPSALCSEFLNFSAKDTAAVGDSFINTVQNVSPDEFCAFACCNEWLRDDFSVFSRSLSRVVLLSVVLLTG